MYIYQYKKFLHMPCSSFFTKNEGQGMLGKQAVVFAVVLAGVFERTQGT